MIYFTHFILWTLFVSLTRCRRDFDYSRKGPTSWWFLFPDQCDDLVYPYQSPIDLSTIQDPSTLRYPELSIRNYDSRPLKQILTNDGNHLILSIYNGSASVSDGPLPPERNYHLDRVQWRWGSGDYNGSEHRLDNRGFAMELQFVHYDKDKFRNLNEALEVVGEVVILSILFTSSIKDETLSTIYSTLTEIQVSDSAIEISSPFSILDILPTSTVFDGSYYSYRGSMTTPPCQNTVTWIVFKDSLSISHQNLESLRSLRDDRNNPILNNCRHVQRLQNRRPLLIESY